jgi:hypothetical protein
MLRDVLAVPRHELFFSLTNSVGVGVGKHGTLGLLQRAV